MSTDTFSVTRRQADRAYRAEAKFRAKSAQNDLAFSSAYENAVTLWREGNPGKEFDMAAQDWAIVHAVQSTARS